MLHDVDQLDQQLVDGRVVLVEPAAPGGHELQHAFDDDVGQGRLAGLPSDQAVRPVDLPRGLVERDPDQGGGPQRESSPATSRPWR